MNRRIASCLTLLAAAVLSGCATTQSYFNETEKVDTVSAYQLVARDPFENIDLAALLDPGRRGPHDWGSLSDKEKSSYQAGESLKGREIDIAFQAFEESAGSQYKKRRNEIQERILAASVQRCNAFKGKLQRDFSRVNFGLGVASATSATAAAVVQSLPGSRVLSGIAAALAGTRAEYDQSFFANLTVNVIVDGIEARQRDIYLEIVGVRELDAEQYTAQAAVKDALYFHGACSIVVGLQYAGASIKTTQDPGLDAATRILLKVNNLKAAAKGQALDSTLQTNLNALGIGGTTLVSAQNPSALRVDSASPIHDVQLQIELMGLSKTDFDTQAANLKKDAAYSGDFSAAQAALKKAIDDLHTAANTALTPCLDSAKTLEVQLASLKAKIDAAGSPADSVDPQQQLQKARLQARLNSNLAQNVYFTTERALGLAFDNFANPAAVTEKAMQDATAGLAQVAATKAITDGCRQ